MSKTYKGYELYKMIAEGKIKEGTKFKANQIIIEFDGNNFVLANSERSILFRYADKKVAEMDFELIEDEIDIQNIPKLEKILFMGKDMNCIKDQFNEIIDNQNKILEAVKQLDRKSGGK